MAELREVRRRERAAELVVAGDRGVLGRAAQRQHVRDGERRDPVGVRAVEPRVGDHEPVDAARAHELDLRALDVGTVVRVDDEQLVAVRGELVLDLLDEDRLHDVGERRDEHADDHRAARAQARGDHVRAVADLARGGVDARRRRVGVGGAAQRARDRRGVQAAALADGAEGHRGGHVAAEGGYALLTVASMRPYGSLVATNTTPGFSWPKGSRS